MNILHFIKNIFGITKYKINRRKYNIGRHSYIGVNTKIENRKTRIGSFCSIADNVQIGLSNHPTNFLTTHPVSYTKENVNLYGKIKNHNPIKVEIGLPCEIGNDVWIGQGSKIFGGVKIGTGAIIGAGSIVTKDIPPYAIAVGVPARIIKYRFSPEVITKLLKSKWWELPDEEICTLPFDDPEKAIEIILKKKN